MSQTIYTTPIIRDSKELTKRAYVEFYYNAQRTRIYNGKCIGLMIFPNYANSLRDRKKLLTYLKAELTKALASGSFPKPEQSFQARLTAAINEKKASNELSDAYKQDLDKVYHQLSLFLTQREKRGTLNAILKPRIEEFLEQFNSSYTYYKKMRSRLNTLLTTAHPTFYSLPEVAKELKHKRSNRPSTTAFDPDQLTRLMKYLKEKDSALYLCCMLSYWTWLNPHREVTLLTKGHFTSDYSKIILNEEESKSGLKRELEVPAQLRDLIKDKLDNLDDDQNIFSGERRPLSVDYFRRAWDKMRRGLTGQDADLVRSNQGIMSFLHSAARDFYTKEPNIELLQKLMGHNSSESTGKYLRSLPELTIEDLKDSAPILPL